MKNPAHAREAVNPECRVGKHGNCDSFAMCDNEYCNDIHDCQCSCHDVGALGEMVE